MAIFYQILLSGIYITQVLLPHITQWVPLSDIHYSVVTTITGFLCGHQIVMTFGSGGLVGAGIGLQRLY